MSADDLAIHWLSERLRPAPKEWLLPSELAEHVKDLVGGDLGPHGLSMTVNLTEGVPIRLNLDSEGILTIQTTKGWKDLGFFHGIAFKPEMIGFFRNHYVTLSRHEPPDSVERVHGMGAIATVTQAGVPSFIHYGLIKTDFIRKIDAPEDPEYDYYFMYDDSYLTHALQVRKLGYKTIYEKLEEEYVDEVKYDLKYI